MHDVHEAGGVPAIINELMKKDGTLHPDENHSYWQNVT